MMEADRLGEGSLSGVTARVKCDKTSGSQSGLLYQTYSNSHKSILYFAILYYAVYSLHLTDYSPLSRLTRAKTAQTMANSEVHEKS